jgi:membrane protein YqaA with SNARE-associated domain
MSDRIKYLFIWCVSLFVLTVIILYSYPEYKTWVPYFYYIIASTTFISIPHEPLVFYYGKMFGIYLPVLVAIIPTILGCYVDYLVLTPLLQHRKVNRLKETKVYQTTIKYFKKAQFVSIMTAAASPVPVPFYPIRVLSISCNYPMHNYICAVLLGRIPRYFFLAAGGKLLNIPDKFILVIFIVIIFIYCIKIISKRVGKFSWKTDSLVLEESMNINKKNR